MPGASATLTVVVKPSEGYGGAFPPEGKDIFNQLTARAKQTDSNLDNNSVTVSTKVLPSPNRAPVVTLTAPVAGNPIPGPTQITVSAVATDPDGAISKVRFYDNSDLIKGHFRQLCGGCSVRITKYPEFFEVATAAIDSKPSLLRQFVPYRCHHLTTV